jgi:hypothetical protein
MNPNKTVIEINGVKMEVDLRTARRIDTIQVGTRVKTLHKKYGDSYEVKHGIVIRFEPFKELPTIIIAIASIDYNVAKVEFLYYNAASKDVEVVVAIDDDLAALDKTAFCNQVDREIAAKEREIEQLKDHKQYFLDKFRTYWEPLEQAVADTTAE